MNRFTREMAYGIPGTYAAGDEGGGAPPAVTDPVPPATVPPTPPEPTAAELAEKAHKAELDRYRNEKGQADKKAAAAEAELQKLRDAQLSETEKLQKTAEQVPTLEKERDEWKTRAEAAEAEIAEDVKTRTAALPAELSCLLPGGTPSAQLAWIRTAEASAAKLKTGNGLPPSGNRNPPADKANGVVTDEQRKAHLAHTATRF